MKPLTVPVPKAAEMIGRSVKYFRKEVLPHLDIIPGSRPLVVVESLERWVDTHKVSLSGKRARLGSSASGSTAKGSKSGRVSPTERRLLDRVERFTAKRSQESDGAEVVLFPKGDSRRSRANG